MLSRINCKFWIDYYEIDVTIRFLRDGTDVNLPLLPNLPMRARLVAREMTRNLIACGNLMAVEGDDEEEFWENEFRRTIIQPEPGTMNGKKNWQVTLDNNVEFSAPIPRAGINLFRRREPKLKFYKNPFPRGKKSRRKRRKWKFPRAQPKLAERITQLVDPPKYPLWLGKLWTFFCILIALLCIAVTPCLRIDSGTVLSQVDLVIDLVEMMTEVKTRISNHKFSLLSTANRGRNNPFKCRDGDHHSFRSLGRFRKSSTHQIKDCIKPPSLFTQVPIYLIVNATYQFLSQMYCQAINSRTKLLFRYIDFQNVR